MSYANLDGIDVVRGRVHVPARGAWVADVVLVDDSPASGRVTLTVAGTEFRGTVVARAAGTGDAQRSMRIVGGAGGWGLALPPKDYRSDAGLRARTIVEDLARESGEELAEFAPSAERVGVHFARRTQAAAVTLEQAIGTASWWVAYDGRTHVGQRPATDLVDPDDCVVLEYDPLERTATLDVDLLSSVPVGARLEVGLDEPQTIAELTLTIEAGAATVAAWCGEDARGRLAGAIQSAVQRMTAGRLHGLFRYRVTQRSAERLELQAVRRDAGLPDMLPIAMAPGVAGAYAELEPGAVVYVQFVEGDPTMPVVTGFASRGEGGHVPERSTLAATTQLLLGGADATQKAVLGDDQANALKDHIDDLLTWAGLVQTAITGVGGALDSSAFIASATASKSALDAALSTRVVVR